MKKVLAVILLAFMLIGIFALPKVSADTSYQFAVKRTIITNGILPIAYPTSQFPVGLVVGTQDNKGFSLFYVAHTLQPPYVAIPGFINPEDGSVFYGSNLAQPIADPNKYGVLAFSAVSPQFKTLAFSTLNDQGFPIEIFAIRDKGMYVVRNLSANKPDGYNGSSTLMYTLAADDNRAVFGTLKNGQSQIAAKGAVDYYGRIVSIDPVNVKAVGTSILYYQQNSFAPQGAEVSIPLSLDGNILYLLISRRGVIENGKVIAGSYSILKIDLSQNNKIVASYNAVFNKDDTYASFVPISFAQTAQDKIPVIEAVAKADLTTGAKVSSGNMYIATVDRNTLKVDDWLIDTGISQSKFVQAMYSNGIVVVMGNVDNNNDIIKAFDINKKQALWTATVPLSNFYLSQDGVVYITSPNSVIAKDALTGNDLATYTLQNGTKSPWLFTFDPDDNAIWVRYWDDNKKVNCFAELSLTKTYTITASAGSGGTISPSGTMTVKQGESKTFTITPDKGYKIKDVKVDGKSVGAVSTYTFENVTSDHTIEATFAVNTYTITASAGSGGSISPSGTITVNYGESKTFTITPDKGYKISDVKVDGKSVGAVSTYTFFNITDNHTIEVTFEKNQIVIVLQVGQTTFTVNGTSNTLDSPPIIKNGRTLLPIRPVVEALGGSVSWDGNERKVTISLGSTTIELWIGKNTARVNGVSKPIDSTNSKVVPEIINGRTMLPLRFVTENLGCTVQWDGSTQTITITYGG
jgi:hypothetical protein